MKKILLPTDFSENAYNAVAYAAQLFKEETCTFYLLNAYTPVLYDSEFMYYTPTMSIDDIYSTNSQKGLNRVEKRIKKEFPNKNHQFEKRSVFHFLTDAINEIVEKEDIDLVIMGTQGATGAQEILLGSNTIHAIKKTDCPVLVIPSEYAFQPLKNILLPTDLSIGFRDNQLSVLRQIGLSKKSKLHILHVLQDKALSQNQEEGKKILAKYFNDLEFNFHIVEQENVPDAIEDFQEKQPVELLAMINNKHSFFENLFFQPVIHKIGFHVKVPFLVLPSGKYSTRAFPVNVMK